MFVACFRPERRTPKSRKLFLPAPCTDAQASQQKEPQAAHEPGLAKPLRIDILDGE